VISQKCPSCKQIDFIPIRAINNVKEYGSKEVTITCTHCETKIDVQLKRKIEAVLVGSKISLNEKDNWGE
jgi:RNase P subunit RPR2